MVKSGQDVTHAKAPRARQYYGRMTATWRATQKAHRRAALMRSAAHLFAERGFAAVSTIELGDAVGMTGPALYRHFASKEALLVAVLVDTSERLLAGGQRILDEKLDPASTLSRLVAFHLQFATTEPDVIRIQDRELPQLAEAANHQVRSLQRQYVQLWDGALALARPDLNSAARQTYLLGTFGLLNSTPHSAAPTGNDAGVLLAGMAVRALLG